MAEINKVKVAGTIYDIQDKKSRDNSYLSEIYGWDGVADGMESLNMGGLTYYRYSDHIQLEPGQVLAGSSSKLMEGYMGQTSEDDEMYVIMMMLGVVGSVLGCDLGPLSLISSGINISRDGFYKDILFETLFENAPAEIIDEFETLMKDGASVGFSLITQMMLYLNIPKEITLSKELMEYIFGEEEELIVPEGLWLLSADLGNMFGWRTFPVHTDTIYLFSPQMSNIVNQSIDKLLYFLLNSFMGGANEYNTSYSYAQGVNQVSFYVYGSSSSNSNTYFPQDRRVIVEVDPLSGYVLDSIIISNKTTGEQIENQYYGQNSRSFYMPDSDVMVNITMKQVQEAT